MIFTLLSVIFVGGSVVHPLRMAILSSTLPRRQNKQKVFRPSTTSTNLVHRRACHIHISSSLCFPKVFGLEARQETVYAEVSPLVISVMDGYNACIFAYGQVLPHCVFSVFSPVSSYYRTCVFSPCVALATSVYLHSVVGKQQNRGYISVTSDKYRAGVFNRFVPLVVFSSCVAQPFVQET